MNAKVLLRTKIKMKIEIEIRRRGKKKEVVYESMVQSLDREFFIHSNFEISNCKNMQRDTIICNIFLYRTKDRAITNVLVDLSFRYRFYEYFEFYKILYRIECNDLFRCILLTKLRICINNRSLA